MNISTESPGMRMQNAARNTRKSAVRKLKLPVKANMYKADPKKANAVEKKKRNVMKKFMSVFARRKNLEKNPKGNRNQINESSKVKGKMKVIM